ncbi:MAG: tungstate ABC transporter substrate-binding protein WtpA [Candidatus Lokiarchaeota archaeon]|nr:tungstate ABC transporter substrate-binding protein WtpA [Candidatus Lokiarchaeota archaeon]
METKSKLISGIISIVVISGIIIGGFYILGLNPEAQKTKVKIFNAGSLTIPLQSIEAEFEDDFPKIDILLESGGSVQCVSWITEAGKTADVLALADWSLIPGMDSQYQDYYIKFATNEMVICYTDDSSYKDDINNTNFWEYFEKSGVIWGFSNPNLDPCGYRTLMVLQLAEIEYGNSTIFDNCVVDHSDIEVVDDGLNYNITTNEPLNPDTSKIRIRDKSVDLVTLLQEGSIDYAFEYLSVAVQHNLNYITLEDAINLKDSNLDTTYNRVKVIKDNGEISTGKSITYGVTVPKIADHPDLGARFIEYLINGTGQAIFTNLGQPPLIPCLTDNYIILPTNLQPYCFQE